MRVDASPEHVPLKLRERFRELEQAIQEAKQLLARLRELGAQGKAEQSGTQDRPEDVSHQSEDVTARLVVARVDRAPSAGLQPQPLQGLRVKSA